uniref:Uncharacterized protein n=1 Tax=viral metagenome TaxID=1070528 RepID=A0A6M3Y5P6_9ZZZZ
MNLKMNTKEIYDNEIAPLLREAGDICTKNDIPFLAVVEYASGMIGRTSFQTNDECIEMVMIRHCAKTSPNIDAYMIGLMRWAKKKNINLDASIVIRQLTSDF